jgi:hypothetical protein
LVAARRAGQLYRHQSHGGGKRLRSGSLCELLALHQVEYHPIPHRRHEPGLSSGANGQAQAWAYDEQEGGSRKPTTDQNNIAACYTSYPGGGSTLPGLIDVADGLWFKSHKSCGAVDSNKIRQHDAVACP